MQATAGKLAVLATSDGKTMHCGEVFSGMGGHRLTSGFQMQRREGARRAAGAGLTP